MESNILTPPPTAGLTDCFYAESRSIENSGHQVPAVVAGGEESDEIKNGCTIRNGDSSSNVRYMQDSTGAFVAFPAPVESCMYRTLEHESPFLIVHPFLIPSDSSLTAATAGT